MSRTEILKGMEDIYPDIKKAVGEYIEQSGPNRIMVEHLFTGYVGRMRPQLAGKMLVTGMRNNIELTDELIQTSVSIISYDLLAQLEGKKTAGFEQWIIRVIKAMAKEAN